MEVFFSGVLMGAILGFVVDTIYGEKIHPFLVRFTPPKIIKVEKLNLRAMNFKIRKAGYRTHSRRFGAIYYNDNGTFSAVNRVVRVPLDEITTTWGETLVVENVWDAREEFHM